MVLAQSLNPSDMAGPQPTGAYSSTKSGSAAAGSGSDRRRSVSTTIGPSSSAPAIAMTMRLKPRRGVNTKKTIARAGMFIVAEPCTIAMAPSMPAPRRWNADETGTMHAEHRFITGPIRAPLTVRLKALPDSKLRPLPDGKRNASANPATRNAKVIPTATSRR